MFMKNILLGNGINIQFGGRAYTSNFIMKRIKYRALMGEYEKLFGNEMTSKEIVTLLNDFVGEAKLIISGDYDAYINDENSKDAMEDFKVRYNHGIEKPHDIMLEDWFFVVHMFFLKNIDLYENRQSAMQGFEQMILDAIYNSGRIQTIHIAMSENKKVCNFFKSFDNIFTLNYDCNIEELTKKQVFHLHGDFKVLSNSENENNVQGYIRKERNETVFQEDMRHCFCNALLNYSGKLKGTVIENNYKLNEQAKRFGYLFKFDNEFKMWLNTIKQEKSFEYDMIMTKIEYPELNMATDYYFDKLKNIDDELVIIGMSPNNDAHIFDSILKNNKLKKVTFYYMSEQEHIFVEENYPRDIFECAQVNTLWKSLNCNKQNYNCNYNFPEEIQKFVDIFNSLSLDEVTSEIVIEEVNKIPRFEMKRLCKMVKENMLIRNPEHESTSESDFIKQNSSISYIALQEGILPSVLYTICVMNFNDIKD